MKERLLQYLCCPFCNEDLTLDSITSSSPEEINEGSLKCKSCQALFYISSGIPILLKEQISNITELEFRESLSEEFLDSTHANKVYDIHHFSKLALLRINSYVKERKAKNEKSPKLLDIGIGWGINYLPLVESSSVELFGIDFSYKTLLMLKKIYQDLGVPPPNLICASLQSIPLKNIKFDIIVSTQVYQHVPNITEIQSSFGKVIDDLMKKGKSIFIVDNLNYNYFRFLFYLKWILTLGKSKISKEKIGPRTGLYTKYYHERDFSYLMKSFKEDVVYNVFFTENCFHPELKIIPKSSYIAYLDSYLSKTPFARFLGRQISLVVEKKVT